MTSLSLIAAALSRVTVTSSVLVLHARVLVHEVVTDAAASHAAASSSGGTARRA
jgi:hypothetical protein